MYKIIHFIITKKNYNIQWDKYKKNYMIFKLLYTFDFEKNRI